MQNTDTLITENTALSLELFHVQTNTSFDFPLYSSVICIGKPNGQRQIDIDVSNFPDADIVSRCHAEIRVEGNTYYIQDLGSSNGTYIRQTKLEPHTPYQLNLGDQIEFGQGNKVTFILQYKQVNQSNIPAIANPTTIQPQGIETNYISTFSDRPNRASRFMGLVLIVAGFVMLAANTRIGIFVSIPSVVLCFAGIYFLIQRRFNRNIGWILIGLGIAVILFTGNFFASFNLLAILIASTLLFAGYQIFNTGKVLNYGWQDVKKLFKK
ncbi:MAG: FHA domain-containing protein [Calothrix sp. MO_167.B42]|nr:FHA domain-containing protein [Calothrix sp. MO_167.B42]